MVLYIVVSQTSFRHQTSSQSHSPCNTPMYGGVYVQSTKIEHDSEPLSHHPCHEPRTSLVLDYVLNSVSAIINLPVAPFMGAAREGWGQYFRNFHGKMHPPGEPNGGKQGPGPSRGGISSAKRRQGSTRRRVRHRPPSPSLTTATARKKTSTDPNSPRRVYRRRRNDGIDNDDVPLSAGGSQVKTEQGHRIMEDAIIRRMAARLQILWQELKIPRPDRTYIVAMYLAGSFAGAGSESGKLSDRTSTRNTRINREEVQRELTRQTSLLLTYRAATIKVCMAVLVLLRAHLHSLCLISLFDYG